MKKLKNTGSAQLCPAPENWPSFEQAPPNDWWKKKDKNGIFHLKNSSDHSHDEVRLEVVLLLPPVDQEVEEAEGGGEEEEEGEEAAEAAEEDPFRNIF